MDLQKLIKNKRIVAGISGGPDSMYLLDMLSEIRANVLVAHMNHGIRGKESDNDEKFVKNAAKKYGYPFVSKKIKIKGPGIEEKAREKRYEFLRNTAKKHKAAYIVLAHTLDDNVETIILNLVRGCSIKGLCGMQEIQKNILRPLLNTKKEEILEYLKEKKLPYRIDSTNKDTNYRRNFVRLKIIPKLKKINPNVLTTIGGNLKNFAEIEEYFAKEANKWIKTNVKNDRCSLEKFQRLGIPIRKFVIMQIFENMNKNTLNVQKKHVDEILSIIKKGAGRKYKIFQKVRTDILNKTIVFSKIR